ncbi:MAG: hypothetical protein QM725_08340 [Lacibacter sp.]
MTTNLKVISASHGTLKQKKSLTSGMLHIAVTMIFAVMALTAMSFTQDDTTKYTDHNGYGQNNTSGDSTFKITLISGIQHIVITNKNAFSADVRINDMDLNTWVSSMMAYSYKRINYSTIGYADNSMDAAFTNDENENNQRSVIFGKNLSTQLTEADQKINETFVLSVETPLFQKTISEEMAEADANMDKAINDEVDNKAKAVQFTKSVNNNLVDEDMDMMLNASAMSKISPAVANDADKAIDLVFLKNTFQNIDATSVFDADRKMDELMNNCN